MVRKYENLDNTDNKITDIIITNNNVLGVSVIICHNIYYTIDINDHII